MRTRELSAGYSSEVDAIDEREWHRLLGRFQDASIYQTRPYGAIMAGQRNVSHIVLREHGELLAAAQVRIASVPAIRVGLAYVHWGPLCRRADSAFAPEVFRQAVRALRNEFVCRRGLTLRVFPGLFQHDASTVLPILAEEGLIPCRQPPGRTLLMDLSPTLETLRERMGSMWKRNLKFAERQGLEVVQGSSDELFRDFAVIYTETVARKRFLVPNDISRFQLIQTALPEDLKMKIMLCRSGKVICAGLVASTIGDTALPIFAATADAGKRSCGSYLLYWKFLEHLKRTGTATFNFAGIDPARNPGTYKFKADFMGSGGTDVFYLGRFDAPAGVVSSLCIQAGDAARRAYRCLKHLAVKSPVLARVLGQRREL